MTAPNSTLPPPPYQSPMVDNGGLLSNAWLSWFKQMFLRAGGFSAPSNSNIFNNPMTTLGDTLYEGTASSIQKLSGNASATKKFLTQTGTGSGSAAPTWLAVLAADVPTLNQNTTGTAANVTGIVAQLNGGTGFSNYASYTRVSNDVTITQATGGTLQDITGLVFPIAINEVWGFEAELVIVGATGGMKFAVNGPTSLGLVSTVSGNVGGPATYSAQTLTAVNTASTTAICTAAASVWARVVGTVTADATHAGTIQLRATNVTNATAVTVKAGSWMKAVRIA